jgi:hypothetical protein
MSAFDATPGAGAPGGGQEGTGTTAGATPRGERTPSPDPAEIRRTLAVLYAPDAVIEMRAITSASELTPVTSTASTVTS